MEEYSLRKVLKKLQEYTEMTQKELICAILDKPIDSDEEVVLQLTPEKLSHLFTGKSNMNARLIKELLELPEEKQLFRADTLISEFSEGMCPTVIAALRNLVKNQVVLGGIYPDEADALCGEGEEVTEDTAPKILWRIIMGAIIRDNIKANQVKVNLEQCFSKRLVPGKTSSILVGRTDEIEEIATKLEEEHFVVITGLPGIGKSKIAEAFVERKWNRKNVLWLRYENSMRQTILSAACLTANRFTSDDARYKHIMDLLNVHGKKLLIVLDNANCIDPNEKDFTDFCEGNYTKLVLTRDEWMKNEYTHVAIGTLSEDELRQVYLNNKYKITIKSKHLPREDGTSEAIKDIISGAHFNTFAVELMGKLVSVNKSMEHQLCEKLKEKHGVVLPEPLPFIVMSHDRKQESTIKEHLLWLVSSRKYGDVEKRMLGLFALLSGYGVPKEAVFQWGGNKSGNLKAVNRLVNHGLLVQEYIEDNEEYVLLHPLLRDIFYEKFPCKSGDFPCELNGILGELEQPRGLWMQNLLCISDRMQLWQAENAEGFLRCVFMNAVDYGLEESAQMVRSKYMKVPVEENAWRKDCYDIYMGGVLLWRYPKSEEQLKQAELMLDSVRKKYSDGKMDNIEEDNLWMRSCLALADISWNRGEEEKTQDILLDVVFEMTSSILIRVRLAEEMFSAMSHYEKLFKDCKNLVNAMEKLREIIFEKRNQNKLNWLKLNLAFARIARGAAEDAQEIFKYLDAALAYGENHHLQESIEYFEAKEMKAQMEA